MTHDEMKQELEQFGEFAAAVALMQDVPTCRSWTDYDHGFRGALQAVYSASLELEPFEDESPIDELTQAAFSEGWSRAVTYIAALLGYDKGAFSDAVALSGEFCVDSLPDAVQARLRTEFPSDIVDRLDAVDALIRPLAAPVPSL